MDNPQELILDQAIIGEKDEIDSILDQHSLNLFEDFTKFDSEYFQEAISFVFEVEKRLKFVNVMKTKSSKKFINSHVGSRLNLVFYSIFYRQIN